MRFGQKLYKLWHFEDSQKFDWKSPFTRIWQFSPLFLFFSTETDNSLYFLLVSSYSEIWFLYIGIETMTRFINLSPLCSVPFHRGACSFPWGRLPWPRKTRWAASCWAPKWCGRRWSGTRANCAVDGNRGGGGGGGGRRGEREGKERSNRRV